MQCVVHSNPERRIPGWERLLVSSFVGRYCTASMVEGKPIMATAGNSILYLSYDGLTDPLGQSQILPYLGGLSRYGITIISFEKQDRFETGKGAVQDFCKTHNLNWVPLTYHKSPRVFSTVYDVWRLRTKARSLHRKCQFKIIHCRSYITALVGLWMKRKYNIKFIF